MKKIKDNNYLKILIIFLIVGLISIDGHVMAADTGLGDLTRYARNTTCIN